MRGLPTTRTATQRANRSRGTRPIGRRRIACALALLLCGAPSNDLAGEALERLEAIHPDEFSSDWATDAQGIATDGRYWYITQTQRLSKIPVGSDLASEEARAERSVEIADIPELVDTGLEHFGDLAWYAPAERDAVLLVPLEPLSDAAIRPLRLAVFRARDLAFAGSVALPCTSNPRACDGAGQQAFGWVAISPDHRLFSSSSSGSVLHTYTMTWRRKGPPALFVDRRIPLRGENGSTLRLHHVQGGAFTSAGDRLYLSTGYLAGGCAPGRLLSGRTLSGEELRSSGGLHVIDPAQGVRIGRSTNGDEAFAYRFDPTLPSCQEPEGLVAWEFGKDGGPPGVFGALHVLRVSHGLFRDAISLYHYSAGGLDRRPGDPPRLPAVGTPGPGPVDPLGGVPR
jgi:hypothetical protein